MADAERVGPALREERDARMARWLKYVEIIKHEVWDIHHHRAIWRQMRDALVAASPDEGTFLDHYSRLYAERQLIAVRRLVDVDLRTASMTRLLSDLAEHPDTMTRAVHLALWESLSEPVDIRDQWRLDEAHASFDQYADGDGDNVDPSAVRKDLADWKTACATIKKIVDKRIAHFEAVDDATMPEATYKDLDGVIDAVGELVRKYTLLFTAASIVDMEPAIQGDWKRPFYAPLFK